MTNSIQNYTLTQYINTHSLVPVVNNWLANSRHPCILHGFDYGCNLINERREVLSVVAQEIGNGPFSFVVEDNILISEQLSMQSTISIQAGELHFRDLAIRTVYARLWSLRPDWEDLHRKSKIFLAQLPQLKIANYQSINSPVPLLHLPT